MPDYDLSHLPDLLARLENDPRVQPSDRIEPSRSDAVLAWMDERRECAAAIRTLMAERDRVREFVGAVEKLLDWMNGCDLSADHEEQKPDDYSRLCKSLIDMHSLLGGSPVSPGPCAAAVAAEREACAKVCEEIAARAEGEWPPEGYWIGCKVGAKECRNAIRARGAA